MIKLLKILCFAIIIISPGLLMAAEWETYDLIDRLLTLQGPVEPIVHGDFVVFTQPSNLRAVGIAFAHEGFANIHHFRGLLFTQGPDAPIPPGQRFPEPFRDSGVQFFVFQPPENLTELEYRLVINGLWTVDPLNPRIRQNPVNGLAMSVFTLPPRDLRPNPLRGLPQGLKFTFHGPPGEIITVGGCFNNWDPFMFELKEGPAGVYTINIPLPSGTYQYVFFHRGQRFADPFNPRRIYSRDGRAASVISVP